MEPTQPEYPLHHSPDPGPVDNPLAVMQPGEQIICEIKRHPIGLISIYSVAAVVLAALISVAILVPYYVTFLNDQQKTGVILAVGLAMLITLIFTYIGVYVYQANRWIVTSDSVTQITQNSLFDRHSNQLSLANLEDTSSEQHSLIQQLLGYGDLELETAGAESGKFLFRFCPDPNEYARKIIAAHEEFMQRAGAEVAVAHRSMVTLPGSYPRPDTDQRPYDSGMPPSLPQA